MYKRLYKAVHFFKDGPIHVFLCCKNSYFCIACDTHPVLTTYVFIHEDNKTGLSCMNKWMLSLDDFEAEEARCGLCRLEPRLHLA